MRALRQTLRAAVLAVLRAVSALAPRRPIERPRLDPADPERVRSFSDAAVKRAVVRSGPRFFSCVICGERSVVTWGSGALRESVLCLRCGSFNRQRQLAAVVLRRFPGEASLHALGRSGRATRIWNTEAYGAVHEALRASPGYVASEYLDDATRSGEVVGGRLHQDLRGTSFADGAFDLVLSSDVFEHIPEPYRAHEEVLRVLAPGGSHVMTVPIEMGAELDVKRASVGTDGAITHHAPPEWHGDQLRAEGILAFTTFGREMLKRCAEIGFEVAVFQVDSPPLGVFGANNFVIELRKPGP